MYEKQLHSNVTALWLGVDIGQYDKFSSTTWFCIQCFDI